MQTVERARASFSRGHSPRFQTTHWSLIARAAKPDGREALSALCGAYWAPVHTFMLSHGLSQEDAADLTQGLFTSLVARNDLARLDQARGKFRSWLLSCARYYLFNWRKWQRCAKRGGKGQLVDVDVDASAGPDMLTPERAFERRWALTLLERALARLQQRCARMNEGALFAHLRGSLLEEPGGMSDAQLGQLVGKSPDTIKVARHRLKLTLQDCIRAEVLDTVPHPEDVDEEIRQLLDALSG